MLVYLPSYFVFAYYINKVQGVCKQVNQDGVTYRNPHTRYGKGRHKYNPVEERYRTKKMVVDQKYFPRSPNTRETKEEDGVVVEDSVSMDAHP